MLPQVWYGCRKVPGVGKTVCYTAAYNVQKKGEGGHT
jgi:hypothetical protein